MEDCHPLLKGSRKTVKGYSHGLSSNQMEVMASMCDAIFPSIPLNKEISQDQVVSSFYTTSGSQFPLPDEVFPPYFMDIFNVSFSLSL
jgi:long-chain-alcohol oxidase